jgi:hypothetical protein
MFTIFYLINYVTLILIFYSVIHVARLTRILVLLAVPGHEAQLLNLHSFLFTRTCTSFTLDRERLAPATLLMRLEAIKGRL